MSQWLAERASSFLAARTTRRGFLVRGALVGSALALGPLDYVLRPGTAYAFICQCGDAGCGCGSACCDGYTEFCCTLHGDNTCPPGTFAGGWWKADGSAYCSGARYYIDCMGECSSCTNGCGDGYPFCDPGCDNLECGCGLGSCDHRQAGCITFRYGQCHQEIACSGRIACRVVTCVPPWLLDSTCGTTVLVDEATANHNAPCLEDSPSSPPYAFAQAGGGGATRPSTGRSAGAAGRAAGGTYVVGRDGGVVTNGGAPFFGSMRGRTLDAPVVGMAVTPSGQGYWLVASDGGIFTFGDAGFHGSTGAIHLNRPIVGMAPTPSGQGYWLVASDGGIFTFGDAGFHGSTGAIHLNRPIVGMAPTPSGQGYWLVASDGGIFTFGDAGFHGSTGNQGQGQERIVALQPTPSGKGYWLLGGEGGIFAFGDAPYLGSYPGLPSSRQSLPPQQPDPFVGMTVAEAAQGQGVAGYTLYAISGLSSPPDLVAFSFPTS